MSNADPVTMTCAIACLAAIAGIPFLAFCAWMDRRIANKRRMPRRYN